jgi:predicted GIY-YIG superfamily endonuclease
MSWNGPIALDQANVNNLRSSPGTYIIGYAGGTKSYGSYVGRSDDNLKGRVQQHLPSNEQNACLKSRSCDRFWYQYHATAKDAYEQECTTFHGVDGGNGYSCNDIHPAKSNQSWKCPVCGA